jgi:hypothetical protein
MQGPGSVGMSASYFRTSNFQRVRLAISMFWFSSLMLRQRKKTKKTHLGARKRSFQVGILTRHGSVKGRFGVLGSSGWGMMMGFFFCHVSNGPLEFFLF